MERLKVFIYAVIGGICIAIAGLGFMVASNRAIGTALFVVGLFFICTFDFNLVTGKVCYLFEHDKKYAMNIPLIWLGNLVGCFLSAKLFMLTRIAGIVEKASTITEFKLSDDLLSIFILAIFCNFLIYLAVDGFKNNPHEIGKYLSLFFGVTVFIACGFEHCVANMFFISMAEMWNSEALIFIIVTTIGNVVGGLFIPTIKKITGQN